MSNQYYKNEIPKEHRKEIVELYKSKLGIKSIIKLVPYGSTVVRRILKEESIPSMARGNQVKEPIREDGTKKCASCHLIKSLESFANYKSASTKVYKRATCKSCCWKKDRNKTMQRQYGISLKDYEDKLTEQGYKCAICGNPEKHNKRPDKHGLSVDHCHTTGKVRELLCHRCNIIIGLLQENSELCEKISNYITKHK